ncbi:MAG: serine/threonine phosphatase [Cyanobacteria bacterium J06554_11]
MLTCAACQFKNPIDHKFCQRCGAPLAAPDVQTTVETTAKPTVEPLPPQDRLQVRLMPPDRLELTPDTHLTKTQETGNAERYQVLTVLSQGSARILDKTPQVRSPLQKQLSQLAATEARSVETLGAVSDLPEAAYPYLLLPEAAPLLYDTWKLEDTTLLIMAEQTSISSILKAFSTAVDPLQYVYWMYRLTELWAALAPIPQWRASLLQADNLGIDTEQSLRICRFTPPVDPSPNLQDFKAFLKSLLAQPHRGDIASLRQIRQLILAVSTAETLEQLSGELADIGKALLDTPAAITPESSSPSTPSRFSPPNVMPPISNHSDMAELEDPWESDDSALETETPDETPFDSSDEQLLANTVLLDTEAIADAPDNSEATMVLPMKLVSLEDAGQTDVGRQRDHNEDCFLIANSLQKHSGNRGQRTQAHGLYVLCDGMGGHDGGEVASELAAKTLAQYFDEHWPAPRADETPRSLPSEELVVEAVRLANQAIFEVNETEQRAGHERMGTTLVMLLLQGTSAIVAHVGDSRLYQHTRRLGLKQVTIDHEVGQREIQRGIDPEAAYSRPDAYQLTQALGPRESEDLVPSVSNLSFSEDTLLLLCSDGLSDNDVVEDYLESHIDPILRGQKELETGVDDLVQLSNEVNGHDNITAIAIRLKVSPDLEQTKGNPS